MLTNQRWPGNAAGRGGPPGAAAVSSVTDLSRARLEWMRAEDLFVDVGSPAGRGWHQNAAAGDAWWMRHELRFPRHIVDVDLHDADVWQHGAQVHRVEI